MRIGGWQGLVEGLGLSPIDIASDPGNDGQLLELYQIPSRPATTLVDSRGANLLLMTNGSPDRSGVRRVIAELVPAALRTAVAAAAWQYGVTPDVYAQLARRT